MWQTYSGGKNSQEDQLSGATEIQGEMMKVWAREIVTKIVGNHICGIYSEEELTGHTDG